MRAIFKGGEKPQNFQNPVHGGDIDSNRLMNKDDEEMKIDTTSHHPTL
jgi:hypothetical protein